MAWHHTAAGEPGPSRKDVMIALITDKKILWQEKVINLRVPQVIIK